MIMPAVAFDTLAYTKELEAAGVEPQVAEAHARVQVRVLSDFIDHKVASKDDIKDLKWDVEDVRGDIKKLEINTKGDIKDLKEYVDVKVFSLEEKFDRLADKVDSHDARFDQIDAKFERIDLKFEQIDSRFEQVDARFGQVDYNFKLLDAKIELLEQKLITKIGRWGLAAVAFMSALITVYHFL